MRQANVFHFNIDLYLSNHHNSQFWHLSQKKQKQIRLLLSKLLVMFDFDCVLSLYARVKILLMFMHDLIWILFTNANLRQPFYMDLTEARLFGLEVP